MVIVVPSGHRFYWAVSVPGNEKGVILSIPIER
jgi:hypothetical protein